jgi:hypothetical protein
MHGKFELLERSPAKRIHEGKGSAKIFERQINR